MNRTRTIAPATPAADVVEALRRGLLLGLAIAALVIPSGTRFGEKKPPAGSTPVGIAPAVLARPGPRLADFTTLTPSPDARHVADWVADSRDNQGSEFVIVDKKFATVYVFDADARLRGATPVLLGVAAGDDSMAGIGTRAIAEVRPQERTTPAGRFMAELGHNTLGEDVVWIDYDAAVSMHRVRTTNPKERRLERLATPSIDDNRVSYGCINVPVTFYESLLRPIFAARHAPVYVLPEVKSVQQVFGSYDVRTARLAPPRP